MPQPHGTGEAIVWRAAQLAVSQAISLVRLLVLARLLAPDAFGLVAVAAVTISLLMGLSNFGLVEALVQRSAPTDNEYDAAWSIGLLRAALVTGALVLMGPVVASLYGEPDAGPIVRVMGLRPMIDAAASIGVARLTRELSFRRLAFMALPASVADAAAAIALAPVIGVWALVSGTLLGAVVQTSLSYAFAPHRPRFRLDHRTAAPLVRYGQWILFAGIVALTVTSLTQIVLTRALGAAALGKYFVATKLAFLPSDAATAVIGAVALPLYARYRDDLHRSNATFGALLSGQVILLFPLYAIIIALAPVLEGVLGERWAATAPTTQLLAAACMMGVVGDAVTPLLLGQGRSDRAFVIEIVQSGTRLLLLWPLIRFFGVPGAALAWLGGNAASQVAAAFLARDVLAASLGRAGTLRLIAGVVAAALAWLSATRVSAVLHGFPALIAGGTAGVVVAAGVLWALDHHQKLRLRELLPWHASWGPRAEGLPHGRRIDA